MRQYLDLLRKILDEGTTVQTGATLASTGRQPTAKRLHGEQLRFDMRDGFPAVTTKPLWWRAVVAEWLWFMRGDGDIAYLREQGVSSIWEAWVRKDAEGNDNGDLGPAYPVQFRRMQGVKWVDRPPVQPDLPLEQIVRGRCLDGADGCLTGEFALYVVDGYLYGLTFKGARLREDPSGYAVHKLGPHHEVVETDQIAEAVKDIRAVVVNPFDRARRRIIVSLWNPAQLAEMQLPPCHTFHFYDLAPTAMAVVDERRHGNRDEAYAGLDPRWTLNLHLCARSIDAVKGLPFNIASYALMLHVMALVTGTRPGTLTITFNDVHIYDNQFDDVREQLRREPHPLPRLELDTVDASLGDYRFDQVCRDLTVAEARGLTPSMFRLVDYKHYPKLKSESEVAV